MAIFQSTKVRGEPYTEISKRSRNSADYNASVYCWITEHATSLPLLVVHRCRKCCFVYCSAQSRWVVLIKFLASPCLLLIAALNYPSSRGTATAFPLAAFGLSAFLFSTIGAFVLRDDTSKLLLLLASGTILLPVVSFPFLSVYHQPLYERLSSREPHDCSDCQPVHRTSSADSRRQHLSDEIGAQSITSIPFLGDSEEDLKGQSEDHKLHTSPGESDERSSPISQSSTSEPRHRSPQKSIDLPDTDIDAPHLDIRGLALLPHAEFWQLFLMLGLLTGIGLMTIK